MEVRVIPAIQFRFWQWVHDLSGAVEMSAELVRRRAVARMAKCIDWSERP